MMTFGSCVDFSFTQFNRILACDSEVRIVSLCAVHKNIQLCELYANDFHFFFCMLFKWSAFACESLISIEAQQMSKIKERERNGELCI